VTFRRALALITALGLLGLPLLPPEHVHVSESDDHGHSEFIHRHFEPHHPIEVPHPVNDAAEFDHQDQEAALWVDSPFVGPVNPSLPSVDRIVIQQLPLLQPRPLPRWTLTFDHISVHDPPWVASTGLRAPPTFLV